MAVQVEMGERAALHATLFHTEVENRMDATSAGYFNTGEMKAQGAEFRSSPWAPRARSAYARADHRWRNRAMLVALVPAVAAALAVGVVPLLDRPAPAIARVDPPPASGSRRCPSVWC